MNWKIHWMSWERMSTTKNKGGLGFWGFSNFNSALLGKHFWRLQTGEHTLMGKVFKSRYHPRGSFMDAKVGYMPSYAWRSIMSARVVIEKGGKWWIGNDETTKIWKDNWLPSLSTLRVQSQVNILHEDAVVSALIDQDTKQWKRDLIFSIFNTFKARQITSIPLSFRLPEDTFIWDGEKDGKYSVRSAYHLLGEERRKELPASSTTNDKPWKVIWSINLPNRVNNFLWRTAKNILPTRGNLCKKGIKIDPVCPLCNLEPETSEHLFMRCNFAQVVWFSSSLGVHVPLDSTLN